jgi:O-antigen ligase
MAFKPNYLIWPILLLVIAFFSLGLVANKTANLSYYVLVFISWMTLIFQRSAFADFWLVCKQYWPINLAMFGIITAITINQIASGNGSATPFDYPSKIAAFVFLFWLFLQVPAQQLTFAKWGWIIGVILCTIKLYFMDKDSNGRPDLSVWFIELVMLLCLFSLVSIGWNNQKNKRVFITQTGIQIFAGACGLYAAYISETRGIWIALPVFLFFVFATYIKRWNARSIIIFISCIAIFGLVLTNTTVVNKRINEAKENIRLYTSHENTDTSIGTRLQLWQASWLLFKEHPLIGIGQQNYAQAMQELADQKIITPHAARFVHSHNEILYKMMTYGVFGLIAILLFYLVPAYYFVRELRHPDHAIKASALMGLCVCLGYFIFGLVDVMLKYSATNDFYCISIALFLAHIVNRKKALEIKSQ